MSKHIETRIEFQELAKTRLDEAKVLLDERKWDGAYYLAGYALEFGLKVCVIRAYTDSFPPDKKFSERCFTHELEKLVELSKLVVVRDAAASSNPQLARNWQDVKDWSEQKRYHRMTQSEAETLYNAIADPTHGVFQWLTSQW